MMLNTKYIFFGTPEFAAIILEKLIKAGFIPEAVVCNPDKPAGRKKIITAPPAKKVISEKGLADRVKIFQPENITEIKSQLSDVKCQLFIVAAYAKIIPKEILEIPRLGTIGVHPSLLPKYRGSSPIQTAILNGEKETGTTLYLMDEKVDRGAILINKKLKIKNKKYNELYVELAGLGADLLIELLRKYENIRNYKKIIGVPQNESLATYTKKFTAEDVFIKPGDLKTAKEQGGKIAVEIERKIRALNPEPGVWTQSYENTKVYEITKALNKRVKLLEADLDSQGKLRLKKIQFEGKKPAEVKD